MSKCRFISSKYRFMCQIFIYKLAEHILNGTYVPTDIRNVNEKIDIPET
jgi:hypothetical protein